MKNKVVLLLACFILNMTSVLAATQIKVIATEEFKTDEPSKSINVVVPEESVLGNYTIEPNSVLHCNILEIVNPKRGKRNAVFFVQPVSYTSNDKTIKIEEEIYGKYSKSVLSKEELKKIPPSKILKSAALSVGNHFVKGLSIAYSFGEGIVKNENDNRLKSGVTSAYEASPLSYISEGEQLDIKTGDEFYFVFKLEHDEQ